MTPNMSRRNASLSRAACSGPRGGQSRVLERPGRGAFAITPIAQPAMSRITHFPLNWF